MASVPLYSTAYNEEAMFGVPNSILVLSLIQECLDERTPVLYTLQVLSELLRCVDSNPSRADMGDAGES